MKKRTISLLLCLAMSAAVLAGCGSKEEPKEETQAETAEAKESEEETAADAQAVDTKQVYVSPEWVQSVLDGNQEESSDYVVLECSWGTEDDAPAYGEAHVPGALHMNTDNVEEEQNWNIRSSEELEQLAKDFGITKDTTVICYSDAVTNSADDRVAFAFLWAGVENVKCIDGGFEAWTEAGYETESGTNQAIATEQEFGIEVPAHPEYILTVD